MKCTDSDVSLVLSRSQYVHENTEFSLQSFSSNQFSLLQRNFHDCDGKWIFAHLRGTGHIFLQLCYVVLFFLCFRKATWDLDLSSPMTCIFFSASRITESYARLNLHEFPRETFCLRVVDSTTDDKTNRWSSAYLSLCASYFAAPLVAVRLNYRTVTNSCVFTGHFIQNILHFGTIQILYLFQMNYSYA